MGRAKEAECNFGNPYIIFEIALVCSTPRLQHQKFGPRFLLNFPCFLLVHVLIYFCSAQAECASPFFDNCMNRPSPLQNTCVLLVALPGQTGITTYKPYSYLRDYKGSDGVTAITPIFAPRW